VKSGQNNKSKILSALETSGIKSHTKIIMSQNTLPQLLMLLSPKHKSRCSASHAENCHYSSTAATHTEGSKASPPGYSRRRLVNGITTPKIQGPGLLLLRSLQEAAHLKWKFSWNEENEQIYIDLLMNDLDTFLNGLPSSPRENLH